MAGWTIRVKKEKPYGRPRPQGAGSFQTQRTITFTRSHIPGPWFLRPCLQERGRLLMISTVVPVWLYRSDRMGLRRECVPARLQSLAHFHLPGDRFRWAGSDRLQSVGLLTHGYLPRIESGFGRLHTWAGSS
ncbi:hypothetical protein SCLCIDRAFT_979723 [Scleroderma citrinum Foug A]|uniref:Uncharacterized protein n=1 Tax=Scleroderma citrinum Foug A TaxID=1036808 RepID=A0A0C3DGU9_9AGAM|nr:hypothetical protein SCLCIDRAFT_979723 [Scleroderma citrinum Foug A]